jgi:polyhydroxyalkanoate synthase
MEAINQVCAHTGEDSVNLAGYCLGGTLTMTTLAYMAAKKDKRANSATFFTTMLDFSEPGELGIFLDEGAVEGSKRRWPKKASSKVPKWPAPSTCCAPTT